MAEPIGKLHHRMSAPSRGSSVQAMAMRATNTPNARIRSGATTAPFARTVEKRTSVAPNRMKLQLAMNWIWRAIGTAGLSGPTNSTIAGRSNRRSSATTSPVMPTLPTRPARVIRPTRSHLPAPIFCAAIAETAAPSASAGIWT